MSEDRSTNGHKSWLDKLVQAFVHEPKNRQELLELLREAHSNEVLDIEALSIIEGALQEYVAHVYSDQSETISFSARLRAHAATAD